MARSTFRQVCDASCKLSTQSFVLGFAVMLALVLLILLFVPFGAHGYAASGVVSVVSDDFDKLKDGALKQAKFAASKDSVWWPARAEQRAIVTGSMLVSGTNERLFACSLLAPGQVAGFSQLQRIQKSTLPSMMGWNFDYSNKGRFWCSGMFQAPLPGSFVFTVMRLDLASADVRAQFKHTPGRGEQTLYFVSCGFGLVGRSWQRSSYHVVRGGFMSNPANDNSFTFQSVDGSLEMSSAGAGQLSFDYQFGESGQRLVVNISSFRELNAPQPNGNISSCAPCISGVGTSSWSYVNSTCTAEMVFQASDRIHLYNGIAWFDRQIVRTQRPSTAMTSLSLNVRSFNTPNNMHGLGRNIWMSFRFYSGTAYMIWSKAIPTADTWTVSDNMVVDCFYTRFIQGKDPEYGRTTVVRVLNYQTIVFRGEPVRMPTVLTCKLLFPGGNVGDLAFNANMFQDAWTYDQTSAPRWTSGMLVHEGTEPPAGKLQAAVGLGSLEISGMATKTQTMSGMLDLAGIQEDQLGLFLEGDSVNAGWQTAIAFLLMFFVVLIAYIVVQSGVLLSGLGGNSKTAKANSAASSPTL